MKRASQLDNSQALNPAPEAYPIPATVAEEAGAVLGGWLSWIHHSGMSVPAILFLEFNRPLSFLIAPLCLALDPLLSPLFPTLHLPGWTALLEQRSTWNKAIAFLEEGEQKQKGGRE